MGEIDLIQNYETYREALRQELTKQADSFVRTGYLLRLAMDTDILKDSGYSSVNDFAKAEFGLDASMVSRYININMRFSWNGYSGRIKPQYEGMGYAKLSLMLLLPDSIAEELTPAYSKAEVQEIKEEYEAEKKVSDLEVLLEGENQLQAAMENNMQKVLHQLMHDQKELFSKIWGIPMGLNRKEYDRTIYEILAPQGEQCYSVRVQGTGRMMLFVKGTDTDLALTNIRTGEKEYYSWEELERAVDKLTMILMAEGKPTEPAKTAWEGLYGESFGEKETIAPVQQAGDRKADARKKSKVAKAPEEPPAAGMDETEKEQVPGQTSIEKDFPEYLPEGEEKKPENLIKTECEGDLEEETPGEDTGPESGPGELSIDELIAIEDRMWETNKEIREILVDLAVRPRSNRSKGETEVLEDLYKKAVSMAADAERILNG